MEPLYHGHTGAGPANYPSATVKETPFTGLSNGLVRVSDLRLRIVASEEKLCGPNPPEAASKGEQLNAYGGLFGAIDVMHAALDRIERSLP
jgi:hypothetical protein